MLTKQLLLVFIGGGGGSVCRYLITKYIPLNLTAFPYNTMFVNIAGSFIIGLIMGWALKNDQLGSGLLLLLATGFCGGFTTFSTFAYENLILLQAGNYKMLFLYIFISLGGSMLAVFTALSLIK